MNRLLLHSANERGSEATVYMSIGRVTLSLTSQITSGSVTSRVQAEVEIEEDFDHESRIIDDDEDPLSNTECKHNNDTPDSMESAPDNDEQTAPPKINLESMVEGQQKMIDIFIQHNTELLEWRKSSTSDSKDEFKMAQSICHWGGARKLETYLGSLWLNFRTP